MFFTDTEEKPEGTEDWLRKGLGERVSSHAQISKTLFLWLLPQVSSHAVE